MDPTAADAEVIDLSEPDVSDVPDASSRTRVRVSRGDDRLAGLSEVQRRRLIIRVLCELVALDGIPDGPADGVADGPVVTAAASGA